MDVDAIKPGVNFVETVRLAIGECDGLVAIIGSDWLQVSDATGARRLDDPTDLVRLEIATALERGIPVIPVLVQGARMPREADRQVGFTGHLGTPDQYRNDRDSPLQGRGNF